MSFSAEGTPAQSDDAELRAVFDELRRREPIFHTPAFAASGAAFADAMADGYWEVGASGKLYTREFILQELARKRLPLASELGWQTSQQAIERLGPETYLFTYLLTQGERVTRRATIWRGRGKEWQIVYHQGTMVTAVEPDNHRGVP